MADSTTQEARALSPMEILQYSGAIGVMFKDMEPKEFHIYGKNYVFIEYDPMFQRVIFSMGTKGNNGERTHFAAKVNVSGMEQMTQALKKATEYYIQTLHTMMIKAGIKKEVNDPENQLTCECGC